MPRTLIEQPYQAPPGMIDFPFAYVYDGTNLVDNSPSIQNNTITINSDSDFILRHIAGVPTVVSPTTGRFNYRNASGSYTAGNPSSGILFPVNWPVVPEKLYPANHQIAFDLYNTLRAFNACGGTPIYGAQIAFFGVKRVPAISSGYRSHITTYKYRERKYTYSYSLTINFAHFTAAGATTGPQRFSLQLDSYDFELQRVAITQANLNANPPTGSAGALQTNDFQILIYDAQYHGTSSIPINQGFINAGRPNPANAPQYQGIFPTPTLVYPAGGQILFDIVSMLCSPSLPQTYNIVFEGIWRIPC